MEQAGSWYLLILQINISTAIFFHRIEKHLGNHCGVAVWVLVRKGSSPSDSLRQKKDLCNGHWKQPEHQNPTEWGELPQPSQALEAQGSLPYMAGRSAHLHPSRCVHTLLRLYEQHKWEVTCPWTEYSVLRASDAGSISAAFRKWLWAYRFNVGDVCQRLCYVQINAFEGCHFIKTESHKPPEETNPVLGCLYASGIFDSYCWHAWPVYSYRG